MSNQTANTFKTLEQVFDTSETPLDAFLPPQVAKESTAVALSSSNPTQEGFPSTEDLQSDFELARSTLRNLLTKGEHALDNMLVIAAQTESARSFEVASNLVNTMATLAKDLIDLHEKTNKAKGKTAEKQAASVPSVVNNQTNNVVFQGSATDLFDMLDNEK